MKFGKKDVAGTVVLYNSSMETFDNIKTYIDQIEKLYVIDNSSDFNKELIESLLCLDKVEYHPLYGNKGIAAALNFAAHKAIKDGFLVLLTMDDDTRTPKFMVQQMIEFWNKYPDQIGILSGLHHKKPDKLKFRKILYTLTSGNMLNLQAFQDIGPFRDDFFIDHVDHEYGIRLNSNNYSVVELPDIRLEHQLGDTSHLKIGSFVVGKYGSHSPMRLYYFARNGIYVARQQLTSYPLFSWMVAEELVKRCIKAMFLQDKRKERIQMLITGMRHGWSGHLGKYEQLEK